jgi:hypothetical protein
LAGIVEDKKLALSEPVTAKVQISADNNKINFDTLDVSAAFAKINASGPLEKLKYDGYVDLEKLLSEFGQFVDLGPYKITGEISEQGILSVSKDKITGVGSSQVKNLSITSTDGVTAQEPMAEVNFDFAMDRQSNVLTLNSMEVKSRKYLCTWIYPLRILTLEKRNRLQFCSPLCRKKRSLPVSPNQKSLSALIKTSTKSQPTRQKLELLSSLTPTKSLLRRTK